MSSERGQKVSAPSLSLGEKGVVNTVIFASASEHPDLVTELQPHIHLRTYLAVLSVCLSYIAQNFAIVGAGAVSFTE